MQRLSIFVMALLLSACASERHFALEEPVHPSAPVTHSVRPALRPVPGALEQAAPAAPSTGSTSLPNVGSAGPLKSAMVENYMDAEERDLRAHLRAPGVAVLRIGDEIVLSFRDAVLFAGDSLSEEGRGALERVAEFMRHYDHTAVAVGGYTDTSGTPEENLAQSQKRAKLVADTLIKDGVAAPRVGATGYGATHLKIATGPDVKEPRNRRIEIRIVPHPTA